MIKDKTTVPLVFSYLEKLSVYIAIKLKIILILPHFLFPWLPVNKVLKLAVGDLFFSIYVFVSDEAFALLLFENNYDRWTDMALRKYWTGSCVKPKYTTGGNINQTPKIGKSMTNKKGKNEKKRLW